MTTTGERIVALSGLSGVSALTHFAGMRLITSQVTLGTGSPALAPDTAGEAACNPSSVAEAVPQSYATITPGASLGIG